MQIRQQHGRTTDERVSSDDPLPVQWLAERHSRLFHLRDEQIRHDAVTDGRRVNSIEAEEAAFFQAIDPDKKQITGVAIIDISRPVAPTYTATIPDPFLEKLYSDGVFLFGETSTGSGKHETHVYSMQGASQPIFQRLGPG